MFVDDDDAVVAASVATIASDAPTLSAAAATLAIVSHNLAVTPLLRREQKISS